MKNYELLDLIGEVGEDYVQAADEKVVRPRFRWKTLAACAACAALALGAYPAYQAAHPPLHDYAVMEEAGGGALETDLDEAVRAPAGGPAADSDSAPEAATEIAGGCDAGAASIYNEQGKESAKSDIDGTMDRAPAPDIPVQEAADQYDRLLRGMGMHGEGAASYPEWFAGAWIDQSQLTVAIVDGFRTPEREAEIMGWCGSGVVFRSAKYSHNFLDGLMEPVTVLLDGSGLNCGIGVDVLENCLGVDLYSDSAAVPNSVLAALAHLDPDGDAIRVRVFTGKLDTLTDEAVKGSAPDVPLATPALTKDDTPHPTPVDGDKVYHGENIPADAVPGGAYVGELPQAKEEGRQAHYDLLPLDE